RVRASYIQVDFGAGITNASFQHLLNFQDFECLIDLGSGGGFPGLIIAAYFPDRTIHLVEANQRKSSFLNVAANAMNVRVKIHQTRIIRFKPLPINAKILTARAFAPLDQLIEYVHYALINGSELFAFKGKNWRKEMADAKHKYCFESQIFASKIIEESKILNIKKFQQKNLA
ncbi:MAG: RsmG family class I SAM-dependent methyltransferase, partial [Pseudomonadota bacterium]